MFLRFGLEAEISLNDVSANFSKIRDGDYQLFHLTRAADTLDSDDVLAQNYVEGAGSPTWETIRDDAVIDIYHRSQMESDADKRQALVFQASEIVRRGGFNIIGIAWIDRYALPVNRKVKNFRAARLLGENYIH